MILFILSTYLVDSTVSCREKLDMWNEYTCSLVDFYLIFYQGSVFEPLPEEEVHRRKQAEEEKTRAKLEKLNKKQEKKQKQAGNNSKYFLSIK